MDWQRYHAESARETSEQCIIGSIWDPKSRQIHRRGHCCAWPGGSHPMAAHPVVVLMAAPAPTSAGPGSVSLASSTALADRCRVVIERHVKPLPSANPQMLEMFRSQERNSPRWSYIQDKDHAFGSGTRGTRGACITS